MSDQFLAPHSDQSPVNIRTGQLQSNDQTMMTQANNEHGIIDKDKSDINVQIDQSQTMFD